MRRLAIRYEPDPADEVGQLWFDLQADRFSGAGFFWSNLGELPGIVQELATYPLNEPVELRWGYDAGGQCGAVLRLEVRQVSPIRTLTADIEVSDLYDTDQRVRAKFNTTYAAIARFRAAMAAMHDRRANEAILMGD